MCWSERCAHIVIPVQYLEITNEVTYMGLLFSTVLTVGDQKGVGWPRSDMHLEMEKIWFYAISG